jgi:hypothetical protein
MMLHSVDSRWQANASYSTINITRSWTEGRGTYACLKNLGRFTFLVLPSGLRIIDSSHLQINRPQIAAAHKG